MNQVILHADMNAFYVSCEMSSDPSLHGKAVVVGGDVEARHGIVLAKSDLAKKAGIQTGHAIWQARQLCPNLIVLQPNYKLYLRVSQATREIFSRYTGYIEPFGLDEAWLGLGQTNFDDGRRVADEIRACVHSELGITASVGVANNKIMSKLGSDYKKPNATTVITPKDYPRIVWPLPAGELLYVGRSTAKKLYRMGLYTIGDLANVEPDILRRSLGKNGEMLWHFANGLDGSPVAAAGSSMEIKSIGNSTTTPRDLVGLHEVRLTFLVLAESVATRLRENGFRARTVQISIRDNALHTCERQMKLTSPSQISHDLLDAAMHLFTQNYDLKHQPPIRSLGIRGCDLETTEGCIQLSMLQEDIKRINLETIENTIDHIRGRFGRNAIKPCSLLFDRAIGDINPKDDHIIHPVSYFQKKETKPT